MANSKIYIIGKKALLQLIVAKILTTLKAVVMLENKE